MSQRALAVVHSSLSLTSLPSTTRTEGHNSRDVSPVLIAMVQHKAAKRATHHRQHDRGNGFNVDRLGHLQGT